jgi:conjugal transfer mating pair stabilization protein TraN
VEDLERVDWEHVSLDEWLAILAETGYYPTLEDLDLEELTGTGSEYDLSDQREDALERSETRSDGLDSDEARWEAETELWESILPALL